MRRVLLVADVLGIMVGVAVAEAVGVESAWYALGPIVGVVLAKIYGLYDRDEERRTTRRSTTSRASSTSSPSMRSCCSSQARPVDAAIDIGSSSSSGRSRWVVIAGRVGARALASRTATYVQNTVIVGAGDVGQLIAPQDPAAPRVRHQPRRVRRRRARSSRATTSATSRCWAIAEDSPSSCGTLDVERVMVAFSRRDATRTRSTLVRSLRDLDVQIDIVPRLFEAVGPSVGHPRDRGPAADGPPVRPDHAHVQLVKRTFDIAVGSAILLVLIVAAVRVIAIAVRRDSPGPVFFRQERLGHEPAGVHDAKFRTM